jgi:fructose-specific phosphotransferase system IIC component
MIESIIFIFCIVLPSFLLGYCVRWMNEEQAIANKKTSNKTSNILPPI